MGEIRWGIAVGTCGPAVLQRHAPSRWPRSAASVVDVRGQRRAHFVLTRIVGGATPTAAWCGCRQAAASACISSRRRREWARAHPVQAADCDRGCTASTREYPAPRHACLAKVSRPVSLGAWRTVAWMAEASNGRKGGSFRTAECCRHCALKRDCGSIGYRRVWSCSEAPKLTIPAAVQVHVANVRREVQPGVPHRRKVRIPANQVAVPGFKVAQDREAEEAAICKLHLGRRRSHERDQLVDEAERNGVHVNCASPTVRRKPPVVKARRQDGGCDCRQIV